MRPITRHRGLRAAVSLVALATLAPTLASAQPHYRGWAESDPPSTWAAPLRDAQPSTHPRPPPVPRRPYRPRYGRWWPGQVLPPDAPSSIVDDPARYHLRAAPPGYVWLLCDGDLMLVSSRSGLIFEVVPGGE